MVSRVAVAATSGLAAVVLFAIANAFAADSRDLAAIFLGVLSVIALLIAILAIFPRFGSWLAEFLFELLFWWV